MLESAFFSRSPAGDERDCTNFVANLTGGGFVPKIQHADRYCCVRHVGGVENVCRRTDLLTEQGLHALFLGCAPL